MIVSFPMVSFPGAILPLLFWGNGRISLYLLCRPQICIRLSYRSGLEFWIYDIWLLYMQRIAKVLMRGWSAPLSLADDKPVLSWCVSNYASLTDKCFTLSYKSPIYMHISRKLFRFTSLKGKEFSMWIYIGAKPFNTGLLLITVKIRTPEKNCCKHPKVITVSFYYTVMDQNADGNANNVNPDQSTHLGAV